MTTRILINTRTSGKYTIETIDGRKHLVTSVMPIRGDIAMNRILYPDDDVSASFEQFNLMPAPSGHPVVNGVGTSIHHPVANNKHNIGGFLRNSRKKGKRVFCEYCLDTTIAKNSDDGRETMKRIKEGKKLGVSTGLSIATATNSSGVDDFNKPYDKVGGGFTFDHVATLLNEAAAGEHAGTELVLNSKGEHIEVNCFTLNEALAEPSNLDLKAEVKLLNTRINELSETNKQTNQVPIMDKKLITLAIIANSSNHYTVADSTALNAKTDDELSAIISTNYTTKDSAKTLLTNAGFDFAGYEDYQKNKAAFAAFNTAESSRLGKLRADITALNGDYTEKMLADKDEAELIVINKMVHKSKKATRIPEGGLQVINSQSADSGALNIDFS
jgi:hypothetical protein